MLWMNKMNKKKVIKVQSDSSKNNSKTKYAAYTLFGRPVIFVENLEVYKELYLGFKKK